MKQPPKSLTPTLILILLNAAFWFVNALVTIFTNNKSDVISYVSRWIFSFLALIALALLVNFYFPPQQSHPLYLLA